MNRNHPAEKARHTPKTTPVKNAPGATNPAKVGKPTDPQTQPHTGPETYLAGSGPAVESESTSGLTDLSAQMNDSSFLGRVTR